MLNQPMVLIVEDNGTVAEAFDRILGHVFQTEIVGTLAAAAERLNKPAAVDAILLDLGLPNGSGLAVVRRIQANWPRVPMVVVTDQDVGAAEAIQAGAQDFLRKPFESGDQLIETVARAIARHRVRGLFAPADALRSAIKNDVTTLADSVRKSVTPEAATALRKAAAAG